MRIMPSIGNCTYFATSHCFKRGQFKMEMINHWTWGYPIFRKKHKKSCIFPIQIAVDWGDTSDLMSHSDRGLDEQQLNGGVHVAWLPGTFCTKKPMELTELTMKNGGVNQWNMEIYGNECVFFQTSGISSNSKRGHDGNGSSIGKQFPRFGVFPRSRLNGILWIYRIPFQFCAKQWISSHFKDMKRSWGESQS